MNKPITTEEWPIYNGHIHTFTKAHTPRHFIIWALAEAKTGKINGWMIPVYLLGVIGYFEFLILLAKATIFLSARIDLLSLLGYSFLLLFQAVLVIPIVLLVGILIALGVILLLQGIIDLLLKISSRRESRQDRSQLMQMKETVARGRKKIIRSNLFFNLLVRINPASNDIFERTARFLKISEQPTQEEVFQQVQRQYPNEETVKTRFVVLPMDMGFMKLGELPTPIERQHDELLALAKKFKPQIIPFYAADPRHPDIVERVKNNLSRGKVEGIKIYPNLGYKPDDPKLMEIYKLCIEGDFPVVTHCSPGGIWKYGLSREERRANSEPLNYKRILDTPGYKTLKLNLAHFGGAEEWVRHLKGRTQEDEENEENKKKDEPWVRTIYEMIASDQYPNLYTDISYTAFTPKVQGLYIDLVDYLKVLLSNPLVRQRVLFGSDYYMVERESVSEKEASILLRSRLGEDLYKQIAYTNPREFLCIETNEATTIRKRKSTRR
jgi:predicted TIM-barrel fold metal-dependent hydrolase